MCLPETAHQTVSIRTYYVTLIWGAVLILALVIDYVSQKPKHAK